MATGNPYWTVDVGSFFTRDDGHRWFYKGEFPGGVNDKAYREYYVRMFQWATFLPMLRSHGSDTPREIWRFGEPDTPYYDAILRMIRLRYRLLPYIYSMAVAQTRGNYIILKTKCSRYIKRSVTNPKTKRLFYGSNLPSIFPRAVIEEAIILFLLLYHF